MDSEYQTRPPHILPEMPAIRETVSLEPTFLKPAILEPDGPEQEEVVSWLEQSLPVIMRRLIDSENLDMPLFQLPLAQLRLAQALYPQALTQEDRDTPETSEDCGDTMGRLSERLGVRHNALTQAADRLINHGLAERTGDPRDRRIVRLRLTTKGRSWVEARRERRRAHLTGLWRQLNAAERTEFLLAVHVLDAAGRRSTSEQQDPAPVEAPASQQLEALFAQVSCRKEDY